MLYLAVLLLLQPWAMPGSGTAAAQDTPVWDRLLAIKPKLLSAMTPGSEHYIDINKTWVAGSYKGWEDWCSRRWAYCYFCLAGNRFQLRLADAGLRGNLSALGLETLHELSHVWLDDNELTGTIPDAFSNLTKLEVLSLDGNQLTGSLPAGFSALVNMKALYAYNNSLSGTLPQAYSTLSMLQILNVFGNKLEGTLPAAYTAMKSLKVLSANDNRISGSLPVEYSKLGSLKALNLQNNRLEGLLPSQYSSLGRLTNLNLHNNSGLTGPVPLSWGTMTKLARINLNDTGACVPGNLSYILTYKLDHAGSVAACDPADPPPLPVWERLLAVKPKLLGAMAPTSECYKAINTTWRAPAKPFWGWDSWCLRKWPHIANCRPTLANDNQRYTFMLNMMGCGLQGNLSALGLESLYELYDLSIEKNKLTGSLPDTYSQLLKLRNLVAFGNKLTGSLPASYSALTGLTDMNLARNQLAGILSDAYTSLTALQRLVLADNTGLTGSVPVAWSSLTSLKGINLLNTATCLPTGLKPTFAKKLATSKLPACRASRQMIEVQ